MKRILLISIIIIAFLSGTVFANAVNGLYNGHPIVNLVVDGQKVESDVPAFIMEDTTLVPIRVVTETLGMEVGWDHETYTVTITKPQTGVIDPAQDNTNVRCQSVMKKYDQLTKEKIKELGLEGKQNPYAHPEVKQIHIDERRRALIEAGCVSKEVAERQWGMEFEDENNPTN
ncbi:MAG: copper amine oxidase N-terminal domain-containing protein [Bacillaceae bacterium]|nr:copper amine oxidase N-terminal domain-containing protein [Bacillaceae bacterium]